MFTVKILCKYLPGRHQTPNPLALTHAQPFITRHLSHSLNRSHDRLFTSDFLLTQTTLHCYHVAQSERTHTQHQGSNNNNTNVGCTITSQHNRYLIHAVADEVEVRGPTDGGPRTTEHRHGMTAAHTPTHTRSRAKQQTPQQTRERAALRDGSAQRAGGRAGPRHEVHPSAAFERLTS